MDKYRAQVHRVGCFHSSEFETVKVNWERFIQHTNSNIHNLHVAYKGIEMLWGENRGKWKRPAATGSWTQDTWLEPPVLCHWATATGQPPALTILYMYCTGGTECLSRTPGSHSVCAIRTPLEVDRKILSIRKESMLSGFLTLNTQSILLHAGNKGI